MLDLQQLQTFLKVVATKSFNAAARELGCSQSTVTFHIKAIEKELGVQLIDRARFSRTLVLTEHGRAAYEQAVKLLAMAEAVKEKVTHSTGPHELIPH